MPLKPASHQGEDGLDVWAYGSRAQIVAACNAHWDTINAHIVDSLSVSIWRLHRVASLS